MNPPAQPPQRPRDPAPPARPRPFRRKPRPTRRPRLETRPAAARFGTSLSVEGRRALLKSPAYLTALLAHALVLLVLSLWTVATFVRQQQAAVEARLGTSREVEQVEPLSEQALDPINNTVESQLELQVDTRDPFQEAKGQQPGAASAEGLVALGIGPGGGQGRGGDRDSLLGRLRSKLGRDDLLVVEGDYDRVEDVLSVLDLPHRVVPFARFDELQLDPGRQVLVVNCHSRAFSGRGLKAIRAFVEAGGYLFTSDWGLRNLLELAFPEFIERGPMTQATRVAPISPPEENRDDPLLEGVFPEGETITWQVDMLSDIVIPTPRLEVLVEAPRLRRSRIVACTFTCGGEHPGRVLHVLGHFAHQLGRDGYALQQLLFNFVLEKLEGRGGKVPSLSAEDLERLRQDPAARLAEEASLRETLAKLGDDEASRAQAWQLQARLVGLALLNDDPEQAVTLAERFLEQAPGRPPVLVRAQRLARQARVLEQAGPGLSAGASRREQLRAQVALESELAWLRRQGEEVHGAEERAELERLIGELQDALQRLQLRLDPDAAIGAGLEALAAQPPQGPVAPEEWRLVWALLGRSLKAYAQVAPGSPGPFAQAEADLAAARARRFGVRLREDPERLQAWRGQLEQARALRIQAQLRLEYLSEALEGVGAFRRDYPQSTLGAAIDSCERQALLGRCRRGEASEAERTRLTDLLTAWARASDAPEGSEAIVVGELLRGAGARDEAADMFARGLARPDLSLDLRVRARLGLAGLALDRGRGQEALEQLDPLPKAASRRLDVARARCQALRQAGRAQEALVDYQDLLRALGDERPRAFWELAEQTARTYLELGDRAGAKRFLEDLRVLDPRLGGEGALKERLVDLMRELDRG